MDVGRKCGSGTEHSLTVEVSLRNDAAVLLDVSGAICAAVSAAAAAQSGGGTAPVMDSVKDAPVVAATLERRDPWFDDFVHSLATAWVSVCFSRFEAAAVDDADAWGALSMSWRVDDITETVRVSESTLLSAAPLPVSDGRRDEFTRLRRPAPLGSGAGGGKSAKACVVETVLFDMPNIVKLAPSQNRLLLSTLSCWVSCVVVEPL
jgi:hypothetical protein